MVQIFQFIHLFPSILIFLVTAGVVSFEEKHTQCKYSEWWITAAKKTFQILLQLYKSDKKSV